MKHRSYLSGVSLLLLCAIAVSCAGQKLQIESDPPGGTVYINDKPMGKTPVTVSYKDLPNDDNLNIRVEKEDYGVFNGIVQGPKQGGIGESVRVRLSKAPDQVAELNAAMDRLLQAHKMAINHHFVEAERIADQMIEEHPQLIAPLLLKGSILLMSKNFPASIEAYQKVLEISPTNEEATKMLEFLNSKQAEGHRAPASENGAQK